MGVKRFILNSDSFGISPDFNRAVLNGFNNGFLKSASLTTNGAAFESAVNEILPECQKLSVGVHLNLTVGKSLTYSDLLTDDAGNFKHSFTALWLNINKENFLKQIEKEFRAQIEKVSGYLKPTHIDSMDDVHCIPEVFDLVCKLAVEYKIPYVRTAFEEFYVVPDLKSNLHIRYPYNISRLILLNLLTLKNRKTLQKYPLKTNNYILGITYGGMLSNKVLEAGLKTLSDEDNFIVEGVIYPASYLRNINDTHSKEFKLTQDKLLEDTIYRMGYEISSHRDI